MTKTQGVEYCKNILNGNSVGYVLNEDEFRQMLKFLSDHKDVRQKFGITEIYVGRALYNSKCFYLKRADGTVTDFSYRSCFTTKTSFAEFKEACRWAVMPQIVEFVNKVFNGEETAKCEISGQMFKRSEMHVDHVGFSFKEIIQKFIEENNVNISDIKLTPTTDKSMKTEFVDLTFKNKFSEYHKQIALLRLISKEEHKKVHKP